MLQKGCSERLSLFLLFPQQQECFHLPAELLTGSFLQTLAVNCTPQVSSYRAKAFPTSVTAAVPVTPRTPSCRPTSWTLLWSLFPGEHFRAPCPGGTMQAQPMWW